MFLSSIRYGMMQEVSYWHMEWMHRCPDFVGLWWYHRDLYMIFLFCFIFILFFVAVLFYSCHFFTRPGYLKKASIKYYIFLHLCYKVV